MFPLSASTPEDSRTYRGPSEVSAKLVRCNLVKASVSFTKPELSAVELPLSSVNVLLSFQIHKDLRNLS